jgi:Cu/Ag efflux protein CusF
MSRLLCAALVLGFASQALTAAAQAPNVVTSETTTRATVDRIEKSTRVVTLRGDGNAFQSVYVDPSIKAFDDLKVGDVVTVRYVESTVVRVRRDAKLAEVHDTTEEAKKAGNINVVEQLKGVVTVDSIDSQGQTITYRTRGDQKMIRVVQDKKLLEGLRPGDRIEVTLTRERAISIEPARR